MFVLERVRIFLRKLAVVKERLTLLIDALLDINNSLKKTEKE